MTCSPSACWNCWRPRTASRCDGLCWLALGSEGRGEQTIATDQDNALILPDDASEAQRRAALAFGRAVNLALADCGYPLCRGGIMAGEPACCLTLREWRERFDHWIGARRAAGPAARQHLFRPAAARRRRAAGAHAARGGAGEARRTPRFLKQMALNALVARAPLNWLGGIAIDEAGTVDLKLQGAALFVDAARLYSLAHGVHATARASRLAAAGRRMGLAPGEYEAWIGAFEFLQMLRLRIQLEAMAADHPNRLRLAGAERHRPPHPEGVVPLRARCCSSGMHLDYER